MPIIADLLDSLGTPILVVGLDLAIHCRNRTAERLLAAGDGLGSSDGKLSVSAGRLDARLRDVCTAVRDEVVTHGRATTRVMRVVRAGMAPDLVLLCHLRPAWVSDPVPPVVLVAVVDGQIGADIGSLLRDINGLTRTEAIVVQGLLRGSRLADIARELEMSPETARAHVKRAFKKVGVHSQPQLIRHVAIQIFTFAQLCVAE